MVKKKRRVIEITQFKAKGAPGEKDFIKISTKIQKFLENQPGFEHRMLLHNMKNTWTEMIQWRNIDHAKAAKQKLKKTEEGKEYSNSISEKTIKSIYPELAKMF